MRRLGIIGAGRNACILADRARELGIETHCFAWSDGAMAKDVVDEFHDVSVTEVGEVSRLCRELGIGGVVATSEFTILPTAQVAEACGLNGNPVEVAERITNKYRNREATSGVPGLNHPRYWRVSDPGQIGSLDVTYPIIVKPTSEGGKRGICVARNPEELSAAVSYSEGEPNRSSAFIVEEFLEGGNEYSVESLSYHGRNYIVQVTEKESSGAPHCVELGHHQPANLPADLREKVEQVMDRALTAVGIQNGACHTEIKIIDGEIYLIEFNARPGGDHIACTLTELSTGYPYMTGVIDIAFDDFEGIAPGQLEHNFAGIEFVTEQTSYLKPVFDACQDEPWCYEKFEATPDLRSLTHNDGYNTNYFIYFSREGRPDFSRPAGA